jgi:beta-glucosidase
MMRLRGFGWWLAVALLAAACDGTAAESTTTPPPTTAPPASTAAPDTGEPTGPVLVPHTDYLYGFTSVVPQGWAESVEARTVGNFTPEGALDGRISLTLQLVTAVGPGAAEVILNSALQPAAPLQRSGAVATERFTWDLFETESEAEIFGGETTSIDLALAEADAGTYLVLLAAPENDASRLRDTVFLPAVEAFASAPVPIVEADAVYRDPTADIEARVEDLLSRMTLQQKLGQMTLVEKDSIVTEDIAALGIGGLLSGGGGAPATNTPEAWADMVDGFQKEAMRSGLSIPLLYGVDAVHGHNNVKGAVIFPHNIGLGAAGDAALVEEIGRITAIEAAATGTRWNYAPVVAVSRDIRWGRTYETYGEDTALVTSLGTAFLQGLQGADLADRATVLATPKHFVGDGATAWGSSQFDDYAIDQGEAGIDEAVLRADHLPPYASAIDAGALSVMASFSSWDGIKMHEHEYLLTDVLKDELGFEGFVVSDWAGVDQVADDYADAVVASINAGIDMVMVPSRYREFIWLLAHAVDDGDVAIERIDDAVRRILRAKVALGIFEEPFANRALLDRVGSGEHRAVARDAVSRSLVLLKNDVALLPFADDVDEIFVGGEAADNIGIQSGGWTIEWQGADGEITAGTTILEGLLATAPSGTQIYHDRFGRLDRVDDPDGTPSPDVCLAVVGERPYAEGRGDEFEPAIDDRDVAVLANMEATCDRLAVVLVSGRPVFVSDELGAWDALVAAWLPGSEGDGVARVLFGLEPFTGRLPVAWPRSVEQLPLGTEGDDPPLFAYGFGLATDAG